jgi:hypothetical protein
MSGKILKGVHYLITGFGGERADYFTARSHMASIYVAQDLIENGEEPHFIWAYTRSMGSYDVRNWSFPRGSYVQNGLTYDYWGLTASSMLLCVDGSAYTSLGGTYNSCGTPATPGTVGISGISYFGHAIGKGQLLYIGAAYKRGKNFNSVAFCSDSANNSLRFSDECWDSINADHQFADLPSDDAPSVDPSLFLPGATFIGYACQTALSNDTYGSLISRIAETWKIPAEGDAQLIWSGCLGADSTEDLARCPENQLRYYNLQHDPNSPTEVNSIDDAIRFLEDEKYPGTLRTSMLWKNVDFDTCTPSSGGGSICTPSSKRLLPDFLNVSSR